MGARGGDESRGAGGVRDALTDLAASRPIVDRSVLGNNRARAIRFSTLTALCDVLGCQPGDLFSVRRP
ncbi:MAG: helix-turn-helix domain-containing protein [Curtobacterium sp.]